MNRENIESVYRLSPVQHGMLFHTLYSPGSGVYFEQLTFSMGEGFDAAAFEGAWQVLAERHPVLRTSFVWEDLDEPAQVVHRRVKVPVDHHDWRGLSEEERSRGLQEHMAADRAQGFALAAAPLIRLSILRMKDDLWQIVFSYSHMILDGWSIGLLLQELPPLAHALVLGTPLPVAPKRRPFRDYVAWLRKQDLAEAEAWWRRTLAGITAPTPLGVDRPAHAGLTERDSRFLRLPEAETSALKGWCQKQRITLSTLAHGAWALVLSRYSGEVDVVFGSTVSGRPTSLPGVDAMLGNFINTLPVRARVRPEVTALDWLQSLQADLIELRRYEYSPLVDVHGWSEVPRQLPLFESILVVEGLTGEETLDTDIYQRTNYPLTLVVGPDRELLLRADYDNSRFEPETIDRLLGHLSNVLQALMASPEGRLGEVEILGGAERDQLLTVWNRPETRFEVPLPLHRLFEEQAARAPEAPAVTCEGETWSYGQLNARADQIANHLVSLGVLPSDLVGLRLERSLEMVAAILGVLKAGAAYVPLDPAYPAERLAFLVEDSRVAVVLTEESLAGIEGNASDPRIPVSAEHPAYVIYTSGSTGKPKGVVVRHGNVARLMAATDDWFHFGPEDVWTLFHSFAFDFSVWEIWGALLYGGRLVVVPWEVSRSPEAFRELLVKEKVTVLNQTPSAFRQLVQADVEAASGDLALKWVVFGGEALELASLAPWFDKHGDRRPVLVNMYGITETTVHVTYREVTRADLAEAGRSPIGVAIPDLRVHLVDRSFRLLPVGVPGEMVVGGAGVARGYLGRPDLTAERFVPDPFGGMGERLYRSGDLARRLPDGELEYLGRIDHQVKIRGFRIELGEIEAVLASHPAVREAVVMTREDGGDRRLVAYVVPREAFSAADLRAYLKERLPDYMVPAALVEIPAIPLTAHGKVDRRALPDPAGPVEAEFEAPRTAVEELLAGIWSEVLGVERVSRDDGFFDLGGHSLLATRVLSRVRETLQAELPLSALFEAATLADLASRIEAVRAAGEGERPPLRPSPREGDLPLSFAQERLWFLERLQPGTATYNVPGAVKVGGLLDIVSLHRSLNEVVRRHEALRTVFPAGKPAQVVLEDLRPGLPMVDLSALPSAERQGEIRRLSIEEAARPFDLMSGPLLRLSLLREGKGEHVLLLAFHHIVADAWSMDVFLRELTTLYVAFTSGRPSPLPELPVQYADFAVWQRQWLDGAALEAQLAWWRERLAGVPALELATDRPRPARQSFRGATVFCAVPETLAASLRTLARERGVTVYMILMAAYRTLFLRYSGQEDFAVGSPVAGRNQREIEGLIGFFVNTLAIRTDLSGRPSFRDLLARERQVVLGALTHQDIPFQKLVEEIQPERDLSRSPLFQVNFQLQTAAEASGKLELPGLTLSPAETIDQTSKFDLVLNLGEVAHGLAGVWSYSTDLFDRPTVERLSRHFVTLLGALAAAPDLDLQEHIFLNPGEREQLLAWSAPEAGEPVGLLLHELLESQASLHPEHPFLVHEDGELTYGELNSQANQLANCLRNRSVGPEVRVGIFMERSPEMVKALFAILKAGGAYVPLDPDYPLERIAWMLEDSAIPFVLTQPDLLDRLPAGVEAICPDTTDFWWELAMAGEEEPRSGVTAENLAYVIYTSGSTGRPKGVLVPHRGLGNLSAAQAWLFEVTGESRVLQFASLAFDASMAEIALAVRAGATLCLPPRGSLLPGAEMVELLRGWGITKATLPPSVAATLPTQDFPALHTLVVAGEACPVEVAERWSRDRLFVNAYGPTEATVCATGGAYTPGSGRLTLGRPIPGVSVHVTGQDLGLSPAGVPGELCIGGVGVARGYLGRPDLTAERFVPDPFSASPGDRLYRSGDRGRFLADGTLEFLGRIDQQVKIRGFRIELGEIETALAAHAGVAQTAVVADRSRQGLAAYVVPAGEAAPSAQELRDWLAARLPEYMVPSAFLTLPALPLTSSGKVDRKALADPDAARSAPETSYEEPATDLERFLVEVWREILEVPRIGLCDNFFELGGNSINGAVLVNRLQEELGEVVPVVAIFEAPTLAGLAARLIDRYPAAVERAFGATGPADRSPEGSEAVSIEAGGWREGEPLPLSFAQERLWFFEQMEPGSPVYHVSGAFRLSGRLDAPALEASLDEVVRRHAALRTTFAAAEGRPVQIVAPWNPVPLPVADLSGLPPGKREAEVRSQAGHLTRRPFDLESGPLLRAILLRLEPEEHAAVFVAHHIVSDGWSMGVMVREIAALYTAAAEGRPSPLPEPPVQYVDFSRWQRSWISGEALEAQIAWWRERLAGVPVLQLPADRPRPSLQSYRGAVHPFLLPAGLSETLRALSRERGTTLFMTFLAAFEALLSRYSGQEDFAVGSPLAGRNRRELEPLIGFFVNTIVLRADLAGEPGFLEVLERVRTAALGAYEHQDVPFERMVQEVAPERNLSHSPLFQVMLAFQNAPAEALELPGLALTPMADGATTSKFDISLTVFESGPQIFGQWVYGTALFEAATIARWAGHLEVFLEGLAADPGRLVSELPLLTAAEREQLLVDWNVPPADYPDEGFVHQLFEEQVEKTPDAVAVVFEGETLTYRELNARANRLAHRLRRRGAGPETLVGVSAERSFEMVVGLLAILKAGAAYVPLDPALPAERLSYMIEDAGIELLLKSDEADGESSGNLNVPVQPENPAYVIYTSGSTGQPKGVVVSHRALGNRLQYARAGDVLADDAFLQKTTISFDVSILEVFAPLLIGGRTVLAKPGGQQDPAYLVELIRDQRITYTSFPPSLLYALFEQEGFDRCDSLRVVITGGETVPAVLPGQFYRHLPGASLLNRYGPTEATISVTSWLCERDGAPLSLPIGRPTAKARVYLLDAAMQPVPVGIAGEIFLGGLCVARGYLRRPHLTAESFVPDPFADEPGARLYRTGDLARYRPDGAIEFVGRVDHQVKIRGFRVELGEIEAALARHPAVREVAVVDREEGATRSLAAYVVLQPADTLDEAGLRGFLLESLPAYMVPADFVALDELPLTPTGKVDRKALPEPRRARTEAEFEEPMGPVEEILAGIFADVLGLEKVSRNGDFFALGGHSLLATQVAARVRSLLRADLALRQIFESPTVAALAQHVQAALRGDGGAASPIPRVDRRGDLPLSFAQERLWFMDQFQPGSAVYNIPTSVRLRGRLDVGAFLRSLREVVGRHESLRTTFAVRNGRTVQVIAPDLALPAPIVDLTGLPAALRQDAVMALALEERSRPFDLGLGPLIRAKLLRSGEEEHVVLLTLHHIVSDGWSMGVLVHEIGELYRALVSGAAPSLPDLPIQYADFAAWQRAWLSGETLEEQLGYWRRQLSGLPPLLELPTDRLRPATQSFRGAMCHSFLPDGLLQDLRELCDREGSTLFMGLLAAFQALLRVYSRQDDLAVGSPVAGRSRLETERLIGFFLNTLVLRGEFSGRPGFRALLARTREAALGAYAHQDIPFEKLVEEMAGKRDLSHAPLFQVSFTLQNTPRQGLDLPGIALSLIPFEDTAAKSDIALVAQEAAGGLALFWTFSSDLFDAATIDRMAGHFEALLGVLVASPDLDLNAQTLVSPEERRQLLAWSSPAASEPEEILLHQLLERQAGLHPERAALLHEVGELAYGELNVQANQLAHWLQTRGVGPEVRVGIFMERSPEMVKALFAILKAGGAYVPLDPEYPLERIQWVIEDSGIPFLLTQPHLLDRLPAGVEAICPETTDFWWDLAIQSQEEPASAVTAENLAYVIYTSGSTGRPKGVLVPHRGLGNLSAAQARLFGVTGESRVLQFASLAFDASMAEIAVAVRAGATLCLPPKSALLPGAEMVELLRDWKISKATLPPSVAATLPTQDFPALRTLVVAGEACPAEVAERWANGRLFVNAYGPTEATVCATAGAYRPGSGRLTLGTPIPGAAVHVAGPGLALAPTGVPGELCIGGLGVARGYLGRPDLTAERFVPDPFSGTSGARLYRSGDLGRFLADGTLEFMGRIDQQVKVRGFRIEPGEIEAALLRHPAIREAVVLAREGAQGSPADRRLVAYLVPSETNGFDAVDWRGFLSQTLPEHMVPSAFVPIKGGLPLTTSGKIDRRALPEPGAARADVVVEPRTPLEATLVELWREALQVEQVGLDDDFFESGGSSISAALVVNALQERLGETVPVVIVFNAPTIARLAVQLRERYPEAVERSFGTEAVAVDVGEESRWNSLRPVPREPGEPLPLSFAQERLWFLQQLQPDSPAYHMPSAVRLQGRLDLDAFRRSLREIARRHESLRTTFTVQGGGPVQKIAAELALDPPLIDLRELPADEREEAVLRLTAEERRLPFDLARGPLIRATLLRSGEEEHVALLTMHHIVSDGWSMGVLIREIAELYGAFLAGEASPLPELPIQYADFAIWQREWLTGEVLEQQLAYWRQTLAGHSVLQLPTDRPRPAVQRFHGADEPLAIGLEVSRSYLDLGQSQGMTPYMALMAGFQALLHRYARQDDVIVGATLAGRNRRELEPLIGFFVNTLAMRADFSGWPTFREALVRVRETAIGALSHQDLPFEKLVEELQPERDLSRSPVFQVVFQLQNAMGAEGGLKLPGLTLRPIESSGQTAKFDIVLNLVETPLGLGGVWKYNTDLFDGSTLSRMSRHFENLLAAAVADPDLPVMEVPVLSEAERRQLAVETPAESLGSLRLHEVFAVQAARSPEAAAVTFEGETLSYGDLDRRANRIANHLIGLGILPGDLVGLRLERSLEMVAAILGVLKAGAAYVPLDPTYPAERLDFMIEDSGVSVVLSEPLSIAENDTDPQIVVSPGHPAYVIYTSGSTGRPKGVVVRHGNVTRLFTATAPWFGFGPEDIWTLFHSYAFDFSVWEIWGALLYGGRLVVVPWEVSRSPEAFHELLVRERVTVLNQTPSAFRQLIWADAARPAELSLRYVIFGGEALELASLAPWFARHGDEKPRLVNMYGITETTVHVTYRPIGRQDVGGSVIGRAIPDLGIYVLDEAFEPLPVGVPGEIHVGGAGLAQGYLGRPELTAERFVPNPFGEPGSRLYRSGDLARFLADGDMEYLGRIDHQVKIRGFRIELGEIESALAAHPAVREAVVLAREDGKERRLVAYVVPDGPAPALNDLRETLAGSLPDYMLPSALVVLEKMPLTSNGKVDRRALPAPEASRSGLESAYVVPETNLERFLAGLWQEILKVSEVGVHDDFFALGGSSISGAVLINRLQEELGEIVQVVVIFDAPTVAEMAAYLIEQHPAAVARLFGRETLGGREMEKEAAPVGEAELAHFRSLVQPLPALSGNIRKNRSAVFVLSPPRSGTTLMRVMLGGHPRLFSPPELELLSFDTLHERKAAFTGRDAFWLEGVIRAVMEIRGCDADEAEALVAEHDDLATLEFYGLLQEWLGDRILVDKTPSYALDPSILRRAEEGFEKPFYIHLIRHPLGMIHSFEEAKLDQLFFRREHPFTRRQLAELIWRASHENIVEFLREVPAERQIWVRFEDLLREPEATLRGICDSLGLDYHPDMAEPYKAKSERMTDGVHAESRMLGDVKFHQYKGVEAGVAERWRERYRLSSLGDGTRELAARLGYEIEDERDLVSIETGGWREGEPLPLSFAQERLWFFDQMEPGNPVYHISGAIRLSGALDVTALEASLGEVVRRHASLRTSFSPAGGRPVQTVAPWSGYRLPILDLRSQEGKKEQARSLAAELVRQPFDFTKAPLLRTALLRLGEEEHVIVFVMHHIVSDGWSMGVLVHEVTALYGAFSQGRPSPLPELPIQYPDYALWQRRWLGDEKLAADLSYWKETLAGAPVLELPTDRPRPPMPTYRGGRAPLFVPADAARPLFDLGRAEGATPFMVLLAGLAALLSRYSGQEDLSIGSPVANRNRAQTEPLIGFFVNTLVFRTDLAGPAGFRELLGRVRRTALAAFAHQDVPFERVVEEVNPRRDLSVSPLFQVMLLLTDSGRPPLDLPGIEVAPMEFERDSTLFDLILSFREIPAGLGGMVDYRLELFDHATAERMASHLGVLLAGAAADPGRRLSELPLLTAAESAQVNAWSRIEEKPAREIRCLHELFEEHADRAPEAVAVIGDGGSLTYGELEVRANRLAHRLRGLGVGPEVRVALSMPRSLEGVVGILGILKAGGVYVPVDPTYPEERRRWMLEDAQAWVTLTEVDTDGESAARPESWTGPENLAYVIYTSGSTGRPKGVAVSHGAVAAYVRNAAEAYGHGPGERMLQMASWSFDASVLELLAPLASGGSVALWDGDLDVHALLARAVELGVTMVHLTPALLQLWTREVAGNGLPELPIRLMMTGSEAMSPEVARLWPATPLGHAPLLHCYGPTETVVIATNWRVPAGGVPESMTNVPIGRLLPGWHARVVDRHGETVPVGVPGELLIGGTMARGYLDRPDVTAEKFVPDAFSRVPGARLYRTGDLVRWLASGDLEFLGRIDQQVKIRGYRVELGEIEAVLASHPAVAQAVVVAQREKARLVAYFVPAGEVTAGELRDHLAERLPEFMVPSAFVALQALPLNANGKVDRKALPSPEAAERGTDFVAPRTATEELLAELWAGLLSAGRVGAHDDFFQLGGHSLLATQLMSRIRESFGVELPLRRLFERPTLAGLALEIEAAARADQGLEAPPLRPVPRDGDLPLSFAQERFWFLDQLQPGSPAYNMASAVRLRGGVDVGALRRTFRGIARRHESLRTRFAVRGGRPIQVIDEAFPLDMPVVDLRALPAATRNAAARQLAAEEAWRPFDLVAGPLLRVTLLAAGEDEVVLLLTLHHIVSDGWSMGILVREIAALYGAFAAGQPSPLPELPVQYADFARWQRGWLAGETLERQLEHWRRNLHGAPPLLELPTDRPRPAVQRLVGRHQPWKPPADLGEALHALCREEGATLFMGLLALFQALLQRYTGRDDVIVGTPVAGRNRLETEGLIGLFLNSLVLRVDLSGSPDFRTALARTREVTLEAFARQDLPFEKIVEELEPERNLSHSPLFQVMFVLQNAPGAALEMPGVTLAPVEAEEGAATAAKFDLTLAVVETAQGLSGGLEYNVDLFEPATVSRMLGHLQTLLAGVVKRPDRPLPDQPLLTAAEREQLLEWNDTAASYPGNCVPELIAEQAARTPGREAVRFGDRSLTYGELNAAADRLAGHLAGLGVGPEDRVGIRVERSLEMVVAVLGVLKAGGAYVPVDPEHPRERLDFVLRDAGAGTVLTRESVAGREEASEAAGGLPAVPAPEALAYVIYTSGSTGQPKGVQVPHRALVNFLASMRREPGFTADDVIVAVTTLSFDIAGLELFLPLVSGGRVVVAPSETVADGRALAALLKDSGATVMQATPATWRLLLESGWEGDPGLRALCGGEALPRDLAERLLGKVGALWNVYGPTETTIWSTAGRVRGGEGAVPLGGPLANTQIHLLDRGGQPVPVGVPGELFIGGDGVARGYLGRPALTAERFVPDPFAAAPGARLYRTGDLVRRRADGALEFLGRTDHQVKIRGFRIELGEIEAVLAACPGVAQAVVGGARRPSRGLRGARRRGGAAGPRAARPCRVAAAAVHGAVRLRDHGGAAADSERQGGPQGPAGPRRPGRRRSGLRGAPDAHRGAAGRDLGRPVAGRPRRRPGPLLPARRPLAAGHPARVAHPGELRRRAAAAPGLRAPGPGGPGRGDRRGDAGGPGPGSAADPAGSPGWGPAPLLRAGTALVPRPAPAGLPGLPAAERDPPARRPGSRGVPPEPPGDRAPARVVAHPFRLQGRRSRPGDRGVAPSGRAGRRPADAAGRTAGVPPAHPRRRGAAAAVRSRRRAAAAAPGAADGGGRRRGGAGLPADHASHRLRRLVHDGAGARARGPVPGLPAGRSFAAARAADPVRRLRRLAAGLAARGRAGGADRVLEADPGGRRHAGDADRPAAAARPGASRRGRAVPPAGRAHPGAGGPGRGPKASLPS